MDRERIARMANKVAQGEDHDEALENVDQGIDAMIANYQLIEQELPRIKAENVPQRAALDKAKEVLENGIGPYLADLAEAINTLGE